LVKQKKEEEITRIAPQDRHRFSFECNFSTTVFYSELRVLALQLQTDFPYHADNGSPMQLRPVNFPVEDGQLLPQREILCRERCSGQDQAPNEEKER
jgi:hypothetical protein